MSKSMDAKKKEAQIYELIQKKLSEEKNYKKLKRIGEKFNNTFAKIDFEKFTDNFLGDVSIKEKYGINEANQKILSEKLLEGLKKYAAAFSDDGIINVFSVRILLFILENLREKYENGQLYEGDIVQSVSKVLKKYEKANQSDIENEIASFLHSLLITALMESKSDVKESEESKEETASQTSNSENEEIQKLQEEIEKLQSENKQLKEAYARMKNDYSSLRRRTEEEKKRFKDDAEISILKELIDIADDYERALQQIENIENKDLFKGFVIIGNKLFNFFEKKGVKKVGKVGETFDHNYHEALFTEEGEEENKILEIIRNGYLYKDRLMRPAGVKVSIKKKSQAEGEEK
jgi:molecular chaperone GrpE